MIKKVFPIFLTILVFITCMLVLFVSDNIGLSDNGDYVRIMKANNISYIEKENNEYLYRDKYIMKVEGKNFGEQFSNLFKSVEKSDNEDVVEYVTPHHHIIKLSKMFSYLYNVICGKNINIYYMSSLSIIYIALFTLGCYYIFTAFDNYKYQIISFILILFIFCDAGYLLYFNSFYGEALQYSSIILIIGLILQMINNKKGLFKIILLYMAIYYFGGSKLVNIPSAIIIALSTIIFTKKKGNWYHIITAIGIIICLIALIVLYVKIPKWMSNATDYQAVFFGILKQSENPKEDLKQLGIPEKYVKLANTHSYMIKYEENIYGREFKHNFYDKISKWKILSYYIMHPGRTINKLCISIENSCNIRPGYLGNSTKEMMYQTNRWSMWSNVRLYTHLLYEPVFVIDLLALLIIICLDKLIKERKDKNQNRRVTIYYILILTILMCANLVLPIVCNGEADIAKHMFLFTNLLDVLFAISIFKLIVSLNDILKSRKEKIFSIMIIMFLMIYVICRNYNFIDKMYFGTYNGEKICWDIIDKKEDGTVRLISHNVIEDKQFNDKEDNLWKESTIKNWLNNEFLKEFTEEEKQMIQSSNNKIALSKPHIEDADEGNHLHYFTYIKYNSDDLYDTAYKYKINDKVILPTFSDIQKIGIVPESIWLIEPYTNNSIMVRTCDKNGLVLMKEADSILGVRPVIEVKMK